MLRVIMAGGLVLACSIGFGQAPALRAGLKTFDVATIRPVEHDPKGARFMTMQGPHRFVVKDYTLKMLIAAAYDLSQKTVSGGADWVSSEHFDITALTPGDVKPSHDDLMAMLRSLLSDRFKLTFHREDKVYSIYELELTRGGPKIKPSTAAPDAPDNLISIVYPQHILLPARNTTMSAFAALLQRAILDRPVVDKTGLAGRYDFDLQWAPDESQFGGEAPEMPADTQSAPLFVAIQRQLGLKLEATRGPVAALIVDKAEQPSAD